MSLYTLTSGNSSHNWAANTNTAAFQPIKDKDFAEYRHLRRYFKAKGCNAVIIRRRGYRRKTTTLLLAHSVRIFTLWYKWKNCPNLSPGLLQAVLQPPDQLHQPPLQGRSLGVGRNVLQAGTWVSRALTLRLIGKALKHLLLGDMSAKGGLTPVRKGRWKNRWFFT